MIRKDTLAADRGRRPVFFGANRFMIEEIRDSLSHVYHSQGNTDQESDDGSISGSERNSESPQTQQSQSPQQPPVRPPGQSGQSGQSIGQRLEGVDISRLADLHAHLSQADHSQASSATGSDTSQALAKSELSYSSPNLLDKLERSERNAPVATSNSISGVPGNSVIGPSNKMTRLGYNQKALAQIRNSLKPYKNCEQQRNESRTKSKWPSSAGSNNCDSNYDAGQLLHDLTNCANLGDEEVTSEDNRLARLTRMTDEYTTSDIPDNSNSSDGRNGISKPFHLSGFHAYGGKVIRKPSFEEKYRHNSSVLDDQQSTTRSSSPKAGWSEERRSSLSTENPPPLPPRGLNRAQTPPPPSETRHVLGRTPTPRDALTPGSPSTRGVSPSTYTTGGANSSPTSVGSTVISKSQPLPQKVAVVYGKPPAPPPYGQNIAYSTPHTAVITPAGVTRGFATPAGPAGTAGSAQTPSPGTPSPRALTPTQQLLPGQQRPPAAGQRLSSPGLTPPLQPSSPKPAPMQAWGAKQPPIIVQSVKSREVQKPLLQSATAPFIPPRTNIHTSKPAVPSSLNFATAVPVSGCAPSSNINCQPPVRANKHSPGQIMQRSGQSAKSRLARPADTSPSPTHIPFDGTSRLTSRSNSPISRTPNQSPVSITSTLSTPSTNSDMDKPPPPPYPAKLRQTPDNEPYKYRNTPDNDPHKYRVTPDNDLHKYRNTSDNDAHKYRNTPDNDQYPVMMRHTPDGPELPSVKLRTDCDYTKMRPSTDGPLDNDQNTALVYRPPDEDSESEKTRCTSPIPERRPEAALRDAQRRDVSVRNYSTQAFKFYMEQHVENLLKSHQQRLDRRIQLENEMAKVGLSEEAQCQMRKMLNQKESNYIRLKRAKMNKAMFGNIRTLGIGAFGKVALVRKRDTGHLYAMKTLRKNDVLKRNQVAHVKAERDILAEADNEWVVKLFYSFQDEESLYFVMEYIGGGDMMSLLIKLGIFEPSLARFYVAELVLAIESVHCLGFIHRDIKPDNILIDKTGHIKLTDFGLCTGFRWTHNSKYYQQEGCHERQDSMDPAGLMNWRNGGAEPIKPLVRRRQQQRHLAHSLVGTPNYIAPEVLIRSAGYTSCCDWWSVGVILYEMLVGQPPFLASDPAETQYKVIHWYHYLKIPREARLTGSATDLIIRLCCSADDRLGRNGADDIKAHVFFKDISFEGLRRQKAPHVPVIKHSTDTSNFDPVESDDSNSDDDDCGGNMKSYMENGKHPEHAFYEFTFRRFFDEGGHPFPSKSCDPGTEAPVYV